MGQAYLNDLGAQIARNVATMNMTNAQAGIETIALSPEQLQSIANNGNFVELLRASAPPGTFDGMMDGEIASHLARSMEGMRITMTPAQANSIIANGGEFMLSNDNMQQLATIMGEAQLSSAQVSSLSTLPLQSTIQQQKDIVALAEQSTYSEQAQSAMTGIQARVQALNLRNAQSLTDGTGAVDTVTLNREQLNTLIEEGNLVELMRAENPEIFADMSDAEAQEFLVESLEGAKFSLTPEQANQAIPGGDLSQVGTFSPSQVNVSELSTMLDVEIPASNAESIKNAALEPSQLQQTELLRSAQKLQQAPVPAEPFVSTPAGIAVIVLATFAAVAIAGGATSLVVLGVFRTREEAYKKAGDRTFDFVTQLRNADTPDGIALQIVPKALQIMMTHQEAVKNPEQLQKLIINSCDDLANVKNKDKIAKVILKFCQDMAKKVNEADQGFGASSCLFKEILASGHTPNDSRLEEIANEYAKENSLNIGQKDMLLAKLQELARDYDKTVKHMSNDVRAKDDTPDSRISTNVSRGRGGNSHAQREENRRGGKKSKTVSTVPVVYDEDELPVVLMINVAQGTIVGYETDSDGRLDRSSDEVGDDVILAVLSELNIEVDSIQDLDRSALKSVVTALRDSGDLNSEQNRGKPAFESSLGYSDEQHI